MQEPEQPETEDTPETDPENQQDASAEQDQDEGQDEGEEQGQRILSLEEATKYIYELQSMFNNFVSAHNGIAEYVNNLQENPTFIAGILGHINELVQGGQVFFVHVYPSLSEEDQKRCWRAQLLYKDEQELRDIADNEGYENPDEIPGHRKVDVSLELWDKNDEQWETIVDDDPVREIMKESVMHRLVLMDAGHAQPHFVTIHMVESGEVFSAGDEPPEGATTH